MVLIEPDHPQWAKTTRAPLPVAPRVQSRATRLMRSAPIRASRWPHEDLITGTGPLDEAEIDKANAEKATLPMPIVERLTASAPSCKGYCKSGRKPCETPAVCSGGDTSPKVPMRPAEVLANVVGFGAVIAALMLAAHFLAGA